MAIISKKLAFLDVETTGFDPVKQEIIELGVVVAAQQADGAWRTVNEIDVKVKPRHIETADKEALRVNGYSEDAWMFAHTLEQALEELNQKAKDAIMVAHNVAFDYGFIDQAYRSVEMESAMAYQKFDTISIAFAKLHADPDIKGYSLRALCEYFGITNEKAHTALADARATFEVFQELMKIK